MGDKCEYLKVEARVRYWEDAYIDGVEDVKRSVPFRQGDLWMPTIHLESGRIMMWPKGTTADIHYKVCDQGEYWLTDSQGKKQFKWKGYYVPDDFLRVGDQGYGDYIIFQVGEDGFIKDWVKPDIDLDEWKAERSG